MMELKPCCSVPFPERLFKEYDVGEDTICANVNMSKVLHMMKRFAEMHGDEPVFFILEKPAKRQMTLPSIIRIAECIHMRWLQPPDYLATWNMVKGE